MTIKDALEDLEVAGDEGLVLWLEKNYNKDSLWSVFANELTGISLYLYGKGPINIWWGNGETETTCITEDRIIEKEYTDGIENHTVVVLWGVGEVHALSWKNEIQRRSKSCITKL